MNVHGRNLEKGDVLHIQISGKRKQDTDRAVVTGFDTCKEQHPLLEVITDDDWGTLTCEDYTILRYLPNQTS